MNADDLDTHLRGLGMTVELVTDHAGNAYMVVRSFVIPNGSLAGRICDVALLRPAAIPYTVPSAIHTRPALVPMDMKDPLKTQPSPIGEEWQYWSRRFDRIPTPQLIWAHVLSILTKV